MMRDHFESIAALVTAEAKPGEVLLVWYAAEVSDFIRFNHAKVRQAMNIRQIVVTLSVIAGQRRSQRSVTLTGNAEDAATLRAVLGELRTEVTELPEDPYLLYATEVNNTVHEAPGTLPGAAAVIEATLMQAGRHDMVGLFSGGPICRGFANSLGQRNWHAVENFNFEWCLYHTADKAVKTSYAGSHWSDTAFASRMADAALRLELLRSPAKSLSPGGYRVLLSPVAMAELLGMLAWGGFGLKGRETRQSTLGKLHAGEAAFAPAITITEAIAGGLAPGFQGEGFVKPHSLTLVDAGRAAQLMTSPRSAREYGVATNGAGGAEEPVSMALAGGSIADADALRTLDRGIYVSNLWYLNYSDRQACRMTGMTRFACFEVAGGELKAPVNVMRFDESAYRMFGEQLVGLTATPELVVDGQSYGERSTRSWRTPGAIIDGLPFTL